ncbi:MAG: 4Fe-4S dicluster domain-containing protein [Bacteroidales bacterium]|nr:4Fe-4S dicluster domain-containing protein [Bacteroidales bacterium]
MNRVDPKFKDKLKPYGISDWNECFHCGNCTAICSHSEDSLLMPRNGIRAIQLGLKDKIHNNVDPWLCYYCGDCSEECPRNANPGELMMALRRYLTTVYDWTGVSRIFYTSRTVMIAAFLIVAAAVVGIGAMYSFQLEPIMEFGHLFEKIAIISVAAFILLPNIIRMFRLTLIKQKIKVPLSTLLSGIADLVINMFTQKKTLDCKENRVRWFEHFILVLGYLLLLATTVFLNWFGTDNIYIIIFGYVVGAITFIVTFDFIIRRIRKKAEISKFSHLSDWMFVVWLFLMGLSTFLIRVFIDIGIIQDHLWLYLVHLIILAQWAVIIVPFGKWMHFLYRSFAIYIAEMKKKALSLKQQNQVTTITA